MTITFAPPLEPTGSAICHARAAARNAAVAEEAIGQLRDRLSGTTEIERILLKAAAGAGKSYVLKKLVADAIEHPRCLRVAVIAFQNRQLWPIAASLGKTIGKERVCLFASKGAYDDVPRDVFDYAEVNTTTPDIPDDCLVIVATSHRLGAMGERRRLLDKFGPGANGAALFDVLFVDEAWQLPHHLFDKVASLAPIVVGQASRLGQQAARGQTAEPPPPASAAQAGMAAQPVGLPRWNRARIPEHPAHWCGPRRPFPVLANTHAAPRAGPAPEI